MGRPWCDVDADIKPWLGITSTDHDAVLTVLRDSVEQSVANYVEHEFESTVVAGEVIDGTRADAIAPKNWPILSVQSLHLFANGDGSGGELIDPSQYVVEEWGINLGDGLYSSRGRSTIRLAYTWGFASLPADAKLAILQTVEAEFRRKKRKTIGGGSRSKKDESEGASTGSDESAWDKKSGLPKSILGKLNSYKQGPEFTSQPMATRNL